MRAGPRALSSGALAVAALLTCGRAQADGPAPSSPSVEISPAPARPMFRSSSAGLFLIGVQADAERAVASSQGGWGVTGGLWTSGVQNVEALSRDFAFDAAIGGGRTGWAGQLDGRFLVGWRGYVTDWQGPFARIGGETQLFDSYLSVLSAPAGVVGYEVIVDHLALDVGLHGAFAVSAGYGIYDGGVRDVSDSPVFGAYAWMIAGGAQVGLRWDRLWPHNAGPLGAAPIDDVHSSACLGLGRFALMACANLEITSGPAAVAGASSLFGTTGVVHSISIGLGVIGAHAVAPPPPR